MRRVRGRKVLWLPAVPLRGLRDRHEGRKLLARIRGREPHGLCIYRSPGATRWHTASSASRISGCRALQSP